MSAFTVVEPCGVCPFCVEAEHEARTERSDEPTLELPLPSKP